MKTEKMMTIIGRVMDEESKLPISTTLTIQVDGFGPIKATSDVNGNFEVSIPVASNYKMAVRAPGFETQEEVVAMPLQDEEGSPGYVEIQLTPYVKLMVDGHVLSEKDKKPLNAECRIYYHSDFIQAASKTVKNGKFTQPLTHYGWYMIDFSAPGYVNTIDTVWVMSCKRKVIEKNYYLKPIEEGLTMQLREIHFNFGKATLTPDSYAELDQMVQFLKKNPSLKVEVAGHTDSEGPDDYNLFLSLARAQAVANYINSKGVEAGHLIAKGYGETKPVDSSNTESGKLKNRRVELVVIHQ
jgi:OmpA-OmpF porin, OOP family